MYIVILIILVIMCISLGYYSMALQEDIEMLKETIQNLADGEAEVYRLKMPLDSDANDDEMW